MELFKHRLNKLTLLSLLSAVVVVSTAITGISIYSAQAATDDDSNVTTTSSEEKAGHSGSDDSLTSSNNMNTSGVDVKSLFEGLVVCDLGASEINGQTHSAAIDKGTLDTPKVSVKVMTEREVASLASNETQTSSSSSNDTNIASADCMMLNKSASTSSSNNATTSDNNNKTSSSSSSASSSNSTGSSTAISKDRIAVIEGQDFVPGQVVLVFSNHALVAIDDVDNNGRIDAKVPADRLGSEINFVESGTNRTASFNFDGKTLTSSGQESNTIAENGSAEQNQTAPAATINNNSTNSTKQ
ncbi:MAG TPA: hypothetical protein VE199_04025 [Nitrososphaera sp.]|nr:hypothetical protein [Nitrososphaera sp.]